MKSSVAAFVVPLFVTDADDPGTPVVTVPTDMVAASPVDPCAPVSPLGIVKSSVAAFVVPLFVTDADDPGTPVVTVPTSIVAASP